MTKLTWPPHPQAHPCWDEGTRVYTAWRAEPHARIALTWQPTGVMLEILDADPFARCVYFYQRFRWDLKAAEMVCTPWRSCLYVRSSPVPYFRTCGPVEAVLPAMLAAWRAAPGPPPRPRLDGDDAPELTL